MTHAERLLALAKLVVKCPSCKDIFVPAGCPTCSDIGVVPRFPTLQQVCPWAGLHRDFAAGKAHTTYDPKECPYCQGRGWVPVDSEHATLPCAHEWRFVRQDDGFSAMCRLTANSAGSLEHGPTYNEAAIAALYAEAQREKGKP